MGRRKLEIKRIENKSARQVTFSKRRNGLLKKAKELSVLCDVDVAVLIISSRGKHYNYSSNSSMDEMLQRYNGHVQTGTAALSTVVCGRQVNSSKYARFLSSKELLETVESEHGESCLDHLSIPDLLHLEIQLQTALIQARSTKTNLLLDSVSSLQEKEQSLAEEKRLLDEQIAQSINRDKNKKKKKKVIIDLNALPEDTQTTQ